MYSGTTLTRASGRVLGAHQKIDRLSRGIVGQLLADDAEFPSSRQILHFEGMNGPDAIKRKSPARDEPWHYLDPFSETDSRFVDILISHYDNLVMGLKKHDEVRAAFEAAWLAHAVVDGLTPAHHYPYEEKLVELRGESIETRTTVKAKLLLPGETTGARVRNNWRMWGPGGLLTSHGAFEWGVSVLLVPTGFKHYLPTAAELEDLRQKGVVKLFRNKSQEIAVRGMYDEYLNYGWTPRLAHKVRRYLLPELIKTVALTWYGAAIDAGIKPKDAK